MEGDRRLSVTVGGFALVSLAVLAVATLQLSAQQGLFKARYELVGYFHNVQGLVGGGAVRLAGTRVGTVKEVELAMRPSGEPGVRVVLQLDESVQQRIRQDSVARIATIGLLGDQIVELTIGTAPTPVLVDGDEIATQDPIDLGAMMSQGGNALESITTLAKRLDSTLEEFQEAGGGRSLAEAVGGLESVIAAIQKGDGALHGLIYEPYEGSAISTVESSLASIDDILREVREGKGVLHSLIYDASSEQGVLLQLSEASANLNSILVKIDSGEGTLGLLLNDPTLYEELKLLVGGARRSTVVRSVIDMVTPGDEE